MFKSLSLVFVFVLGLCLVVGGQNINKKATHCPSCGTARNSNPFLLRCKECGALYCLNCCHPNSGLKDPKNRNRPLNAGQCPKCGVFGNAVVVNED